MVYHYSTLLLLLLLLVVVPLLPLPTTTTVPGYFAPRRTRHAASWTGGERRGPPLSYLPPLPPLPLTTTKPLTNTTHCFLPAEQTMADFDDWESDDFVPTLNLPTAPLSSGGHALPPVAPAAPVVQQTKADVKKPIDDAPLIDGEVSGSSSTGRISDG